MEQHEAEAGTGGREDAQVRTDPDTTQADSRWRHRLKSMEAWKHGILLENMLDSFSLVPKERCVTQHYVPSVA